ncbi:hypothetical protein GF357_04845 [Candidatus Dojkabacteria bacterium]|nr:hypothetical protein [Candidatus Dojkabacteria bacterium]
MKVLGIGDIDLDIVCRIDEFPQEGTKISPRKTITSLGGPVPIALILLSRLGVDCMFYGSIGDDDNGQILKKRLENEGVKVIQNPCKKTKVHTVLVNSQNGSRTIIKDGAKNPKIKSVSKRLLNQCDLVIIDRHEPNAYASVLQNKKKATKIIIDPSTEVSDKTLLMLKTADFPIVPIEVLDKISRHENRMVALEHLFKITAKPVIVTAGHMGSLIYDGSEVSLISSFKVDVVDTLGAGDIYRGAFAYGVLKNWSIQQSVEFSNLVSGLHCTKLGNHEAIPSRREIKEFLLKAQLNSFSLDSVGIKVNTSSKKAAKVSSEVGVSSLNYNISSL